MNEIPTDGTPEAVEDVQTLDNVQDASDEIVEGQEESSAQNQKTTKGDRLDKHPRFKEVTSKNRTLTAKVAEYENELKQLREENAKFKGDNKDSNQEPDYSMVDQEIESYFKAAPKPNLKNADEYKSMDELYRDIRRNIYRDFLVANKAEKNRQTKIQTESSQKVVKQLEGIESELGEEYEVFTDFLTAAIDNADKLGMVLDIDTIYATYLANRDKFQNAPKQAGKRPGSKISKEAVKPVAPTAKLSAKQISNMDFDDLVADV